MKQSNVKERDVMTFDAFAKAYDTVSKSIALPADKNAHPGARPIKAEGLFARNDANVYKAAGIPVGDDADINNTMTAGQVNRYDNPHDGQDYAKGAKVVDGRDVPSNQKQITKEAKQSTMIVATTGITATDAGTVSE